MRPRKPKARPLKVAVKRPVLPRPGERRKRIDPATCEPDYADAEREFLVAMERYRRLNGRPFPTCRETLEVLVALGYRKVEEPRPLPGYDAARAAAAKQ